MVDLITLALKSIVANGGILGALVVVFGVVIALQWRAHRKDVAERDATIAALQLGADPERTQLRKTIAELQEKRVHEAFERESAMRVAIERASHATEQITNGLADQTDAIRDFESLVRRRRGGT